MENERGIKKIIIEGETVYLKKSKLPFIGGWGIVYPIKNEDGSTNLTNLLIGGKQNFFKLLLLFLIMVLLFYGFREAISEYRKVADNPCDFCWMVKQQNNKFNMTDSLSKINISILNQGGEINER